VRTVLAPLLAVVALSGTLRAQEEPPATGFAVLRSFPDLTAPDQDGTPCSFRAHRDKVIVGHVCTGWCGPCNTWTDTTSSIQTALEASIGADHFLLVDLLVEDAGGQPSSQAFATTWKTNHSFPGPVLNAEASYASALWDFWSSFGLYYLDSGEGVSIPYFFILAPGCENRIEVRANPNPPLGEELTIVEASDMVAEVERVWRESACVEPLLHRMDRCTGSQAQSTEFEFSGAEIESADRFAVPAATTWSIGGVTVVEGDNSDNAGFDSFDVRFYSNAAGVPGAVVCERVGLAPLPVVPDAGDHRRRFELSPTCDLDTGDYWLSVQAFAPTGVGTWFWQSGKMPDSPGSAFRDPTDALGEGCTDWNSSKSCPTVKNLCYLLEGPLPRFVDGFESGDSGRWSVVTE